VILGAALLGACGDDKKTATDSGTDSGKEPVKDSGTENMNVMCGKNTCTPPEIMLPADGGIMIGGMTIDPSLIASAGFGPVACCTTDMKCGVTQPMLIMDGSCLEQNQEGRPAKEAECPGQSTDLMGFKLMQGGCCRPDNKCGIDLGILGVGCLERTEAARIAGMGGGGALPFDAGMFDASVPMLEAKSCVYMPSKDDGGSGDAGN
jgi:hypothetical protein